MATLENRGNGSWRVTVSGGYGPDGKQIRVRKTFSVDPSHTEGSQRKEVERLAAELETDYRRHQITESRKIKLSEVYEEYMDSHPMAEATKTWYRSCFLRILPALGKVPVQDLTPRHIREFYKKLEKDAAFTGRSKTGKLSGTSRLHHHRALSAVLGFAVRSGYISISPMNAIDPPRADTPEAAFLEGDDIAQLLDVLEKYPDPMWAAFFTLDLYSSCRPGELIGLNWSDLDNNILTIRAGSNRVDGKTIRTDRPKNKSSKRTIALPDEVMIPMKKWRKAQSEYKLQFAGKWPEESMDAVFTGSEGYRIDLSSPTQKWRKIQKKYNLKDVNLYALRHTGASLLIASGADVKQVSGRLGHSRASTTLDKYTHLFEKAAQQTTDMLTDAINQARKKAK